MKLFPNFTRMPFDYFLISWVTNYVSNRGFLTLRPHAQFHYSPLDLVFVSCAAKLPFVPHSRCHLEWLFFGPSQASEGKGRSERGAQGTRAFLRPVCLSLHVHFVRRSPEKQKKNSANSAGYIISNAIRIKYELVNSLKD